MEEIFICELCNRNVNSVSRHHLIPREEGGNNGPTAELCQPCHSSVHLYLTNRELAINYNSIEKLKNAEALQKYLKWIRQRAIGSISNRRRTK